MKPIHASLLFITLLALSLVSYYRGKQVQKVEDWDMLHSVLVQAVPSRDRAGQADCMARLEGGVKRWPAKGTTCRLEDYYTSGPNSPIIQGNQGSVTINGGEASQ